MEKIDKPAPANREAELAKALRANLRRRKAHDQPKADSPLVEPDRRS